MKYRVAQKDVAQFSSAEGTFPVVKGIVDLPSGSTIEAELLDNRTIVPVGVGIIDPDAVEETPAPAKKTTAKKTTAKKTTEKPVE